MVCTRCGYQLEDNCNFCNSCGNPVRPVQNRQIGVAGPNVMVPPTAVKTGRPVAKKKEKSGIGLVIAVIIMAIVLIAATVGLFIWGMNRKVAVQLNDYISVSFSGYNNEGHAELIFNEDKLSIDTESAVIAAITVSLDKSDNLSNGDSVNLVWQCNDGAAEDIGYKLEYAPITYTVSGLVDKPVEVVVEQPTPSVIEMPTPEVVEVDPYDLLGRGWKIEWDPDHPQLYTFENYDLYNLPIQYYNNRMVVGQNYACWSGGPNDQDLGYPIRSLAVYLFNRKNVLTSVRFIYVTHNNVDAERYARMIGGGYLNNIVYVDGDPRTVIGQTTKQAVVDFHCEGTVPILADGYSGSDLNQFR